MRVADLVTAAVLAAVGGVVLYDAARLGVGWGTDGPKSGFFPFWMALILVACCVAIFVQALVRRSTRPFATAAQLRPVFQVLVPVIVFVFVMDLPGPMPGLGLYVASGLYLAFYMRWVGGHGWRAIIALAVVIPVAAFLVFETWFLVPMPKGPVEAWLGY